MKLEIKGAFDDHNGHFVDASCVMNEPPHGKIHISSEINRIFECKGVEGDTKIGVTSDWYPEYSEDDIISIYKDKGADCEIISAEKDGHPNLPEMELVTYELMLPLWYVVWMYLCTYYDDTYYHIKLEEIQDSSKEELKEIFGKYTKEEEKDGVVIAD